MNLQYVSDSTGQTTGVLIPIDEWKKIKEELSIHGNTDVPEWQIEQTKIRLDAIKKGTMKTRRWEDAKKDIFAK